MTTRQPRRTRAQWTEIIERQSHSGQTIRDFCKDNDVGLASFGKWKQKLTGESRPNGDSAFQSISVPRSDKTSPSTAERTTVTLSFGSNVTITIQSNEPTPWMRTVGSLRKYLCIGTRWICVNKSKGSHTWLPNTWAEILVMNACMYSRTKAVTRLNYWSGIVTDFGCFISVSRNNAFSGQIGLITMPYV